MSGRTSTWGGEAPPEDWESALLGLPRRNRARGRRSHCVAYADSRARKAWEVVIMVLLLYIATIFLYNTAYLATRKGVDWDKSGWAYFDYFVNILFWIDLILMFFFTYNDSGGDEVDDLCRIGGHYFRTSFFVNLLACFPEDLFKQLFFLLFDGVELKGEVNQAARIIRLQRASRLARMTRLTRLVKLTTYRRNWLWKWIHSFSGVRLINVSFTLVLFVHILSCGWHICATMHDNLELTWLSRRTLNGGDVSLVDAAAFDQYMNSVYFVLETLTTVGFGDISAVTNGEMFYVCFLMASGTVIHGIIISQVTACFASLDAKAEYIQSKVKMVEAFADHASLSDDMYQRLRSLVSTRAKQWHARLGDKFDKDAMEEFINSADMPRSLLEVLPRGLHAGRLLQNTIFSTFAKSKQVLPPRLPTLLALKAATADYQEGELVYQATDVAYHIFLVAQGTFAFIAIPSDEGGLTYYPHAAPQECDGAAHTRSIDDLAYPFQLFPFTTYFGDTDLMLRRDRSTTARCETDTGILLALHRSDVMELAKDFVQFGAQLKVTAIQRARVFKRKQNQLMQRRTFTEMAVQVIQRSAKTAIERWRDARVTEDAGMGNSDSVKKMPTSLTDIASSGLFVKICSSRSASPPFEEAERWLTPPRGSEEAQGEDEGEVKKSVRKLSNEVGQLDRKVNNLQITMTAILEELRRQKPSQKWPSSPSSGGPSR